jgi:hypothetical protein
MWEHRPLHEFKPPLLCVKEWEREREENFAWLCWKREKRKRWKLQMIVLRDREKEDENFGWLWKPGLTENLSGNRSGWAGLREGADVAIWKWSPRKKPNNRKEGNPDHRHHKKRSMEERKGETLLGCSGWIALRREQCAVFVPCKNCNIETRSRDYATVDEAVFSPCRAELHSYKHLDTARVGKGHVTVSAVTQQLKRFPACQIKGL